MALSSFWRRMTGRAGAGRPELGLETITRERIGFLLSTEHGMPQVDWGAAELWREREADATVRAIGAAWLDELRDALTGEYRRWRHAHVEGLATADEGTAQRTAAAADKSLKVIASALAKPFGRLTVPPVGVVVFDREEEYISFTSHFHPEEGEWATSGGCYVNEAPNAFPLIVTHAAAKWSLESTIAHEMAHHLLHGRGLPLWVEEGFTQMMEERVTGYTGFKLDHEMVERHRHRWQSRLNSFLAGEAFSSGDEDDQELAYNLAQWITRAELSERPDAYFRFVRDCGTLGADESARVHLGSELADVVAARLGLGD